MSKRARSDSSPGRQFADFLLLLERTHLLTQEQMARVRQASDRRTAARQLVESGWLTRWQVEQLLGGRSSFFLGSYKLLDKLGEGGMGAVYKARQQGGMNRIVAIKVLSNKVLNNPDAVQRFLREVRAAAALNHPNIVTAYDADSAAGEYYLVMEYVEGRDLGDWINEYGRLPIDWSCECIRQAALGLEHAHRRNLIHRDVKPSNLLVVPDSDSQRPLIKIMDFGLARFSGESVEQTELTNTGMVMGTIDFISPEQARNTKDATIRSDIFSLGCTLFKMLTGEPPYAGESITEKLMARASDDARRASSFRRDLPSKLDGIIATMLARDPDARYQSPQEVADALASYCHTADSETLQLGVDDSFSREPANGLPTFTEPRSDDADDTRSALATLQVAPDDRLSPTARRRPANMNQKLMLIGAGAAMVIVLLVAWLLWPSGNYQVAILVDQPEATVVVDGTDTHVTPAVREPMRLSLPAGSHELLIKKSGYKSRRDTILVTENSNEFQYQLAQLAARRAAPVQQPPPQVIEPSTVVWVPTEPPPAVGDTTAASAAKAKQLQASWAQRAGKPVTWTNSMGMEFAMIPPGEFTMGSDDLTRAMLRQYYAKESDYLQRLASETPHEVRLTQPFYMCCHEVTQGQFEQLLNINPSEFPSQGPNAPVERVSWLDAVRFCNLLSRQEGVAPYYEINGEEVAISGGSGYRLPTEAQWEYACRAGTDGIWYFGTNAETLTSHGWSNVNSNRCTQPVGEKLPNPFGLYDIYGNVWEWCWDRYSSTYFSNSPRLDPTGPAEGSRRVMRGGSWRNDARRCRSAYRPSNELDHRADFIGFRVATAIETARDAEHTESPAIADSTPTANPAARPLPAVVGPASAALGEQFVPTDPWMVAVLRPSALFSDPDWGDAPLGLVNFFGSQLNESFLPPFPWIMRLGLELSDIEEIMYVVSGINSKMLRPQVNAGFVLRCRKPVPRYAFEAMLFEPQQRQHAGKRYLVSTGLPDALAVHAADPQTLVVARESQLKAMLAAASAAARDTGELGQIPDQSVLHLYVDLTKFAPLGPPNPLTTLATAATVDLLPKSALKIQLQGATVESADQLAQLAEEARKQFTQLLPAELPVAAEQPAELLTFADSLKPLLSHLRNALETFQVGRQDDLVMIDVEAGLELATLADLLRRAEPVARQRGLPAGLKYVERQENADHDEILRRIPAAAGISLAAVEEMVDSPRDAWPWDHQNQPLFLMLYYLKLTPADAEARGFRDRLDDFYYAFESEAMPHIIEFMQWYVASHTGYASLVQLERISEFRCQVQGDQASGSFKFQGVEFPLSEHEWSVIFYGQVQYTAARRQDGWRIESFEFPSWRFRFQRQHDGTWRWSSERGPMTRAGQQVRSVSGAASSNGEPLSSRLVFYSTETPSILPVETFAHDGKWKAELPAGEYEAAAGKKRTRVTITKDTETLELKFE